MRQSATDPYEAAMKRGGYSEAFLKKLDAKRRMEAERAKLAEMVAKQERLEAGFSAQFETIVASRKLPEWVVGIIVSVAASRGINPFHIVSRNPKRVYVAARHEAIYRVKAARPVLSTPKLAALFCMDHTSILYSLTKHAEAHGLPKFSKYRIAHERRRKAASRHFDMKRAA